MWQQLFPHAEKNANRLSKNPMFITLAYQDWWKDLLEIEGWEKIQEVVQLDWNPKSRVSAPEKSAKDIRKLRIDDIAKTKLVDDAGFKPIWRQSFAALKNAYHHADYATVFHVNNQIIGFQISTLERKRAHLARIAVLPEFQKMGVGSALVNDLIAHYTGKGIFRISVNTQSDNKKSLAFYKQLNFEETGESFPIYSLK
jgi:ribosomal protein S18 acetylase RimI-like enzyme